MASLPPSACCFTGFEHAGTPKGSYSTLGDFEIYTVYPENKSTRRAILYITDALGHRLINAQLLADQFAAHGYFVMMPDIFYGDAVPLNRSRDFDLSKWLRGESGDKHVPHDPRIIDPIIERCIHELRNNYNSKQIGGVGYCFGGKYVVRHLQSGTGKIDVGYTAHPSFVDEDELRGIKGPVAISAAENDYIFTVEKRHQTEAIFKELGVRYQLNLYSGVEHGFAVRGDPNNRAVVWARESAFLQALHWLHEHFN